MSVIDRVRKEMRESIDHLREELRNIRTGRANPGMVEGVMIEVYGTAMRLADLATISTPESQQLLISPFDPQNTGTIGKQLDKANLGFQVITDQSGIRVLIPPLDEERRKRMAKNCKEQAESAKVSIRNTRRKYNDQLRDQKQAGELPEDVEKRLEKEIQKLTDTFCDEIEKIAKIKIDEVMQV